MVRKGFILLLIVSIFIFFPINTYANEVPEDFEELIDEIPNDVSQLLPDGIFSENLDEFAGAVTEISSWEYILDTVFDILGFNVKKIVNVFAVICSLLVMCSLLNMLKSSIADGILKEALSMIGNSVIVIAIIEISKDPLSQAIYFLDQISLMVNTMSPLMCSMYAMGGNVSAAIVNNYALIVFLSIVENICAISIEAILGICLALVLASSFMPNTNLLPFCNAIKKTYAFILGIIMIAFTTAISTQSILTSKADSLSSKTAKLFATQMIPVVGGTVGESLKTAGASIEYLRSHVGVAIIVILLMMVLPTLLTFAIYRLIFTMSNGVAALLGCEREGKMILEISSIYGYVFAILTFTSVILLFLVTMFAKCSSPLT